MSEPLEAQIESALAELRGTQDNLRRMQEESAKQTTSAQSDNRMLTVTVDSQRRLQEIKFDGNRHRTLAPAELGSLITETIQRAQDQAAEETTALFRQFAPKRMHDMGLLGGPKPDLDAMLERAMQIAKDPTDTDVSSIFSGISAKGTDQS